MQVLKKETLRFRRIFETTYVNIFIYEQGKIYGVNLTVKQYLILKDYFFVKLKHYLNWNINWNISAFKGNIWTFLVLKKLLKDGMAPLAPQ